MKRIALRLVVGALLVIMIPGVAYAEVFTCDTFNCDGTANRDTISERDRDGLDDNIDGLRGGDTIHADKFTDDQDRLYGGLGNDHLYTNDNDRQDYINCGKGKDDVAILDKRDHVNHRNCESIRYK